LTIITVQRNADSVAATPIFAKHLFGILLYSLIISQHNVDKSPVNVMWNISKFTIFTSAFSALTLLIGHQEEHPACKN